MSEAVPPETWQFPVENGLIVVRPEISGLFCLNETARVVWEALEATGSAQECSAIVAEVFDIPLDVARRDVDRALQGWQASHLLGPVMRSPTFPSKWTGELPLHIADCRIGQTAFRLLTDSEEALAEIAPRIGAIQMDGEPDVLLGLARLADSRGYAVVRDGNIVAVDETVAGCRALLFQEMVRLAAPGREWLALLHAGACGRDERCVIFPAQSYSGKTTLTAALMRDGFFAFSDDFVGVEADGLRVPAMPFALGVRSGSWAVVAESFPELQAAEVHVRSGERVKFLNPRLPAEAASASAMVFTRWEPGYGGQPEELSVLETVIRLNECGFWVAHDRKSIAAFLQWVVGLRRYALAYGKTEDAVQFVRELLD